MSAALKRPSVTRPRLVSTPRQNFTARSTKQPSLAARRYDPSLPINTNLGGMSAQCTFCQAKRWALKPASLCCCNGKVQLNPLRNPPEPLKTLYLGETCASKYFLQHTRKYKSLGGIQVTKFKARSAIEWVVCVACLMRSSSLHKSTLWMTMMYRQPTACRTYLASRNTLSLIYSARNCTNLASGREDCTLHIQDPNPLDTKGRTGLQH